MQFRPGTNDSTIFQQVYIENEYRVPERFNDDDFVLDIGGHIGSFAALCSSRGAQVISVEPNLENFELLVSNTVAESRGRIIPIRAAVGAGSTYGTGWLSNCAVLAEPSGHTLCLYHNSAGETVPVIPFGALLRMCPSRVRFLKLDCEGAEIEILRHQCVNILNASIDEIAIEFHDTDDERTNDLIKPLCNRYETVWRTSHGTFRGVGLRRVKL